MPPVNRIQRITATRFESNPLITPAHGKRVGENINGPSVIRVPEWFASPLGRYYMYFAHHGGDHIRLAYADDPKGPWTVHEPGVLDLKDASPHLGGHIASPDIHLDHEAQKVRMYYHGCGGEGQMTALAHSTDGLHFASEAELLCRFYLRAFPWQGAWYGLAKSFNDGWGELLRSPDGIQPFEQRLQFVDGMRHAALLLRGSTLVVLYTTVGNAPERILAATVDLQGDWQDWGISDPIEVLRPEAAYEGIQHPVEPSRFGAACGVQQLRDPGLLEDEGRLFLYYSVAGEEAIAGAELTLEMKADSTEGN
ncbi:MAG: glycoside hydrolase family protein [Planctomycetota bacterium]|jgi:hypothetical protein